MMNKMPTSKAGKLRLLIALPLTATLLFAFRNAAPVTEAITSIESEITQQDGNNPDTEKLITQLKQNRALKSVRNKKIDGKDAIVIGLKGGGTEVYFIGDAASIAELERKYVLPELPPPPPPATPDVSSAPLISEDKVPLIFSVEDEPYYKNNLPADYNAFLKRNPTVSKLGWKFEDRINFNLKSIVIYLKNGQVESYDFNQNPRIPVVEAKYGKLPNLPAPPPPVPAIEQVPPPPPVIEQTGIKLGLPEKAIYYIDGAKASQETAEKLDPKQIYSINVYKGEIAEKLFEKNAAKGVISIITANNKDSEKVKEFEQKFASMPPPLPPSRNYRVVTEESTNEAPTNAKKFSFILTAANISQQLFNIGKEHFKQNGFDVDFKGVYAGEELSGVNIIVKSSQNPTGTSSYYSINDLKERNYAIMVTGNKETGEVTNLVVKIP